MNSSQDTQRLRDAQTISFPPVTTSKPTALLSKRKARQLKPILRQGPSTRSNGNEKNAIRSENFEDNHSGFNRRKTLPSLSEHKHKMNPASRKTKENMDCEKGNRLVLPPIKQPIRSHQDRRSAVFKSTKVVLPPIKQ